MSKTVWDWGDDEEPDPEYIALQKERRARWEERKARRAAKAESDRPKGTVQKADTPKVEPTFRSVVKRVRVYCSSRSVVRDEAGQPILDVDGRRQYKPCRHAPMKDQSVCLTHGGKSPNALKGAEDRRRAALEALLDAAPESAEALARFARDERVPLGERLKFIAGVLDRVNVRAGVDIAVEVEPRWQRVLSGLFGRIDESTQDDPNRTINGELADKQPANVELTPEDVAALNAAVSERFTPPPGPTPEQMAANAQAYVNKTIEKRLGKRKRGRRDQSSEFGDPR